MIQSKGTTLAVSTCGNGIKYYRAYSLTVLVRTLLESWERLATEWVGVGGWVGGGLNPQLFLIVTSDCIIPPTHPHPHIHVLPK